MNPVRSFRHQPIALSLSLLLVTTCTSPAAKIISDHGYDNLIEIKNSTTRVVLEPNMGGRVLSFQLNSVEILQQNPAQAGLQPTREKTEPRLAGGRFDVGPTTALPKHNTLWQCAWSAEITGKYSARMTSQIDPDLGIQLIREFTLDQKKAHLACKQIMINHNKEAFHGCFWSRTFAKGGGVAFAPIPAKGVFPRGYGLNLEPKGSFNFLPEPEPNVRIRDNILEFLGEPSSQKSIFNLSDGWMAYLSPDDLLFIKTFPFDPAWQYADPPQHHASYWHLKDEIIEIEPNGPLQIIQPGEQAEFTEHWWLVEFDLPENKLVNLEKLRNVIGKTTK